MASHYEAPFETLVTGDKSYHDITVDVAAPVKELPTANGGWFSIDNRLPLGSWMYYLYHLNRDWNMGTK